MYNYIQLYILKLYPGKVLKLLSLMYKMFRLKWLACYMTIWLRFTPKWNKIDIMKPVYLLFNRTKSCYNINWSRLIKFIVGDVWTGEIYRPKIIIGKYFNFLTIHQCLCVTLGYHFPSLHDTVYASRFWDSTGIT